MKLTRLSDELRLLVDQIADQEHELVNAKRDLTLAREEAAALRKRLTKNERKEKTNGNVH